MNGVEITEFLRGYYIQAQHTFVLKNFFINNYECDLFSVTKSDYTYEFEVKTSKQDYHNDFKKMWGADKKHFSIKNGFRTNKFWFVMPKELISVEDIPSYCGLIYVDSHCLNIIKEAPFLHKRKLNENTDLLRTIATRCYYRTLGMIKEEPKLDLEFEEKQ